MKYIYLLSLLFSSFLGSAQKNKRILLPTPDLRYRQVYIPNVTTTYNPQPGDTLVIPTGIHSFYLQHFSGTAAKPIVIIPQDSGWIGGYPNYGGSISYATYFKITGFHIDGKDSANLGLYIGQQTSNYEACNIEIKNCASEGLVAKANPDTLSLLNQYPNWTIQNVSFHDIYVHKCMNENFYLGYTNDVRKPLAPLFNNLSLYNLRSDSSYYMGIVLSDAVNVHMNNILVTHFGISNVGSFQNGIAIGYVTLADSAYNVTISGGTGAGLLLFGKGKWKLRNWMLNGTATTSGQSAIYVSDLPDIGFGMPPLQLDFSGVTVAGAAQYALNINNDNKTQVPGTIANFNYSFAGLGINDLVDKIIVPLPPAAPKTIKSLLITYSDGTTEIKP